MPQDLKPLKTEQLRQSTAIASPSGEEALRYALQLAAGAVCTGNGPRPCGSCAACRKAAAGSHPDIRVIGRPVDSKGNPKREIAVDQIRELVTDAYILPNEAERRVFIIQDADTMNVNAQNAALKLLEEPPNDALFLLCVTNPAKLLPTIRSRCALRSLRTEAEGRSPKVLETAEEYLRLTLAKDEPGLVVWCYKNENMASIDVSELLECIRELLVDALCRRRPEFSAPPEELLRLEELIEQYIRYKKSNVGTKLLFGLLAANSVKDEN